MLGPIPVDFKHPCYAIIVCSINQAHIPEDAQSDGRELKSSPDLIVGLIRQLLSVAEGLGKHFCFAGQDIATAFDTMNRDILFQALCRRGLSFWAAANLIGE